MNAYRLVRMAQNPNLNEEQESSKYLENALTFSNSPTCEDYQKSIDDIRKSFFIHPTREMAEILEKMYQNLGDNSAEFFLSLLELLPEEANKKLKIISQEMPIVTLPREGIAVVDPIDFYSLLAWLPESSLLYKDLLAEEMVKAKSSNDFSIGLISRMEGQALFLLEYSYLNGGREQKDDVIAIIERLFGFNKIDLSLKSKNGKVLITLINRLVSNSKVTTTDKQKLKAICKHYEKDYSQKFKDLIGHCSL